MGIRILSANGTDSLQGIAPESPMLAGHVVNVSSANLRRGGDQNSFGFRSEFCLLLGSGGETTTVDTYVYMQGQRRGPYEKAQLEAMWQRGQIPADTLYWQAGMSKWAVISDLFAADKTIAPSLPEGTANVETTTFPVSW